FYRVMNPVDLPEVMISESRAIQAENIQEGATKLVLDIDGHPILSDIRLDTLPRLNAYTALKSKSVLGAEDVLVSGNFGDPILSVWQVGLGHVAAWMGDIGENWVPEMNSWSDQGQFWAQVVRYTMPSPTFGKSFLSVEEGATELTVNLAFDPNTTGSSTASSPLIALASPSGEVSTYRFTQTGVGDYQLVLDKPEIGAYAGIIQYTVNGEQRQLFAPFAINYPHEWQFAGQQKALAQFESLVEVSGGTKTTTEAALQGIEQETAQAEFDWTTFLLILLVLTWPAEIAIRRWQMPWRRP
ncbi:MAG: glutamine amidotransferase, partial [Anaerolineales bacterium]